MALSDWDDKRNGGQMVLSTFHIEGDKSLRITRLMNDYGIKVLKQTETDTPKNVNVEFWYYDAPHSGRHSCISLFFRYQDLDNYYSFTLFQVSDRLRMWFGLREAGVLDLGSEQTNGDFLQSTWTRARVEFCELSGTVYAYLYKEVLGAWVLKNSFTRSPPKFTGGGAFGVGFEALGFPTYTSAHKYLDTTKIYY